MRRKHKRKAAVRIKRPIRHNACGHGVAVAGSTVRAGRSKKTRRKNGGRIGRRLILGAVSIASHIAAIIGTAVIIIDLVHHW